jgi:hypothetical protein
VRLGAEPALCGGGAEVALRFANQVNVAMERSGTASNIRGAMNEGAEVRLTDLLRSTPPGRIVARHRDIHTDVGGARRPAAIIEAA